MTQSIFDTRFHELHQLASQKGTYLVSDPRKGSTKFSCVSKPGGLLGFLRPARTSDRTVRKVKKFVEQYGSFFQNTPAHKQVLFHLKRTFPKDLGALVDRVIFWLNWGIRYEKINGFESPTDVCLTTFPSNRPARFWTHSSLVHPESPEFRRFVALYSGRVGQESSKKQQHYILEGLPGDLLQMALGWLYEDPPRYPEDPQTLIRALEHGEGLSLLCGQKELVRHLQKRLYHLLNQDDFFSYVRRVEDWDSPLGQLLGQYGILHFHQLWNHPELRALSPSLVSRILASHYLQGPEVAIFDQLCRWAEARLAKDPGGDIKSLLTEPLVGTELSLLEHIRFEHFSLENFVHRLSHRDWLSAEDFSHWTRYLGGARDEELERCRPMRPELTLQYNPEKTCVHINWQMHPLSLLQLEAKESRVLLSTPSFHLGESSWQMDLEGLAPDRFRLVIWRHFGLNTPEKERVEALIHFPKTNERFSLAENLSCRENTIELSQSLSDWLKRALDSQDRLPVSITLKLTS